MVLPILPMKKILLPLGFGLAGIIFLGGLYFGLMSWAEGFTAAKSLFWADRWIFSGLITGFGLQAALYAIMRFRLFLPSAVPGPAGALMGTSGSTSAVAMLACCVHHLTDLLPILGLTAAAAFLARYRLSFLWLGLGMTILGILVMLALLYRARRDALRMMAHHLQTSET
jgi:hypothetical protein